MVTVAQARTQRAIQQQRFQDAKKRLLVRQEELRQQGITLSRDKKADSQFKALTLRFRIEKLRLTRAKRQVSRARGELTPVEERAIKIAARERPKVRQVVVVERAPTLTQRGEVLKRKRPVPVVRKEKIKVSRPVATIEAPPRETTLGKVRRFLTPKPSDSKLIRGLKGGGVFIDDLVTGIPRLLSDATRAGLGNKEKQVVLSEAFNNQTISNIGTELGRQAQSSDPFDSTQGILNVLTVGAVPVRAPAVFGRIGKSIGTQVRKVNVFENKQIITIKANIKQIERTGTTIRDRTPEGSTLRKLEEQRKLIEDNTKLTKKIEQTVKPIERKRDVTKSDLKKVNSSISNQKSKRKKNNQKIKLNQASIAKGLKELTKKPVVTVAKVSPSKVKQLPDGTVKINTLLLSARKISGAEFARLKTRIKKEFNLNVVQRGSGKDIRFKLLEPRAQKKKGVSTKAEKLFEVTADGRIIRKKATKEIDVTPKLTKKQLKDLEFEAGQNLDKLEKDVVRFNKQGLFKNKKAQSQIFRTFNKHKKTFNNNLKQTRTREKQLGQRINKFKSRLKDPVTSPKQLKALRKEKVTLQKQTQKLKSDSKQLVKQSQALRNLSRTLQRLAVLSKSALAQVQAQAQLVAQVNKMIQEFEVPTPKVPDKKVGVPKKPGRKIPPKKIVKKLKERKPVRPLPRKIIKKRKIVKKPKRMRYQP